ncbi:MAG: hypothetical protein ABFD62_00325 [Syntrophaceae bacterium]
MIESALDRIAENILALDEASLSGLWEKYKTRMENFDSTREWEKAVIIFFIINSVRIKNKIFNDRVMERQEHPHARHDDRDTGSPPEKKPSGNKPNLKRVK